MSDGHKARLVYSTGLGKICSSCGWPEKDCKCSSRTAASEAIPGRLVAKLRIEKKGRGGKTVTMVDGLPNNAAFLKELCQQLKRACGTGGTAAEGAIELQGDLRDRVRDCLVRKGIAVKG
jgi:translation initiation factor 1